MSHFHQEKFNQFVINQDIIGMFSSPVVLKSGRESCFYVNWRTVTSDTVLLHQTAEFLIDYIQENEIPVDTFYGVPEGATKTALICSYLWAKRVGPFTPGSWRLSMGRAKPKEHGDPKDRFFIGAPKGKTVVLEDTSTTGGSLIKTLDHLIEMKIDISAIILLTDRGQLTDDGLSVGEVLKKRYPKIPFHSLSSATDLLPQLNQVRPIENELKEKLDLEFQKFGVTPLTWS